jgi:hypothetical protein
MIPGLKLSRRQLSIVEHHAARVQPQHRQCYTWAVATVLKGLHKVDDARLYCLCRRVLARMPPTWRAAA